MKTVVYVSSNRESPEFEAKIRADLVSKWHGPIVSVTQKPIDLGVNIVVGQKGASGFNFCRQVQIACQNSPEGFIVSAEADCLYSPDYFDFTPERTDIPYRNSNIYVQKYRGDSFHRKKGSTFSQVVDRDFYLKRLNWILEGQPQWSEMKNFPRDIGKVLFEEIEYFETKYPCLSFKTGQGMRKHSPSGSTPIYSFPYWGTAEELRKKYE